MCNYVSAHASGSQSSVKISCKSCLLLFGGFLRQPSSSLYESRYELGLFTRVDTVSSSSQESMQAPLYTRVDTRSSLQESIQAPLYRSRYKLLFTGVDTSSSFTGVDTSSSLQEWIQAPLHRSRYKLLFTGVDTSCSSQESIQLAPLYVSLTSSSCEPATCTYDIYVLTYLLYLRYVFIFLLAVPFLSSRNIHAHQFYNCRKVPL